MIASVEESKYLIPNSCQFVGALAVHLSLYLLKYLKYIKDSFVMLRLLKILSPGNSLHMISCSCD